MIPYADGNIALIFVLHTTPKIKVEKFFKRIFSHNKKKAAQETLDNIAKDIATLGGDAEGFSELPWAVTYSGQEIYSARNMESNKLLYEQIHDIGWLDTYDPDIILWFRDTHRALKHCTEHQPDRLTVKEILHRFNDFSESRGVYIPKEDHQIGQDSDVTTIVCHALHEIQESGFMSEATFKIADNRYNAMSRHQS